MNGPPSDPAADALRNQRSWRLAVAGSVLVATALVAVLFLPSLLKQTAFEPSPSASTFQTPTLSDSPTTPSPTPPVLQLAASFGSDGSLEWVSDMTAWSGGFVAVGTRYEGERFPRSGSEWPLHEGRIWVSPNGHDWTDATPDGVFTGKELRYIAAAPNGSLVAVGSQAREIDPETRKIVVWRSVDGQSWQSVDLGDFPAHERLAAFDAGPRGFVFALGDASLWHSDDGSKWRRTRRPLGSYDGTWALDVGAGPEGFVALTATIVGSRLYANVVTSSDGITWMGGEGNRNALQVAEDGGDWILVSAPGAEDAVNEARIFTSADGLDWNPAGRLRMGLFHEPVSGSRCEEQVGRLLVTAGRAILSTWLRGPCSVGAFATPGSVWSARTTSLNRWEPFPLPYETWLTAVADGDGFSILATNDRTDTSGAEFWVLTP